MGKDWDRVRVMVVGAVAVVVVVGGRRCTDFVNVVFACFCILGLERGVWSIKNGLGVKNGAQKWSQIENSMKLKQPRGNIILER